VEQAARARGNPAGKDNQGTLPGAATLVNWADFGFITEPGMDIRQNLNNFNLPGLNRHFCASVLADNQTDASSCRPVIYSKIPFSRIPPPLKVISVICPGLPRRIPIPPPAS
jgi:hypothetical protein